MANPRAVQALQEGLAAHHKGNFKAAAGAYERCLRIEPLNASALQFLAAAELSLGRKAAAVDHARRAATLAPFDIGLIENVTSILLMAGEASAAVALCNPILSSQPRNVRLLYARAVGHFKLGDYSKALSDFDAVLAIEPRHADAHNERGACLGKLGQYERGIEAIERAIQLIPGKAEFHFNLGYLLSSLQKPEQARASLETAFNLQPRYSAAVTLWAGIMGALRLHEEGIARCQAMISRDPTFEGGHGGMAVLLNELRSHDQALAHADRAIALAPANGALRRTRGEILQKMRRWNEAALAFATARQVDSEQSELVGSILHSKLQAADWRGISELINICLRDPAESGSFEAIGFCDDIELLAAIARMRANRYALVEQDILSPALRPAHHRLSIAYVSGDFRNHPVAQLLTRVIELHDRDRFEIIGVSLREIDGSSAGNRIRAAFDEVIDAEAMLDETIVEVLRRRGVDIAIDLMGYTSDPRFMPFVRRVAPIQATWLGYAGTVGIPGLDYLIADPTVIPFEHFEHYLERVVHLPDTYLPVDNTLQVAQAPTREEAGLPEAGLVFCCFNQFFKILPETFDSWMRILSRTPGSVLWLTKAASAEISENLRREAKARGVDPERLIFAPFVPSHSDHLARLKLADLVLDTLPYNAHTTAIDALSVGTPVLTVTGKAFAGRVGTSLLHAAGLQDLAMPSFTDYENMAVALAGAPERIADFRRRLLENRKTQALFDTPRFTGNLEKAFETMWRRCQDGLPPAAFCVAG